MNIAKDQEVRKAIVRSLGNNAAYESLPALNSQEYFALLRLERTSRHSPLRNNVRLAKLRPMRALPQNHY